MGFYCIWYTHTQKMIFIRLYSVVRWTHTPASSTFPSNVGTENCTGRSTKPECEPSIHRVKSSKHQWNAPFEMNNKTPLRRFSVYSDHGQSVLFVEDICSFLLTQLRFSEVVFSHFITKILLLLLTRKVLLKIAKGPLEFLMNGRLLHSLWRIWKIRSLGAPVWSLCWYLSIWVWTRFAIK